MTEQWKITHGFKEIKGDDKFRLRKKLEKMERFEAEVYIDENSHLHILINLADMEDSEGRDFLLVLDPKLGLVKY